MNWQEAWARMGPYSRPGLVLLLGLLAAVGSTAADGSGMRVGTLLLFLVLAPGLALVGLLGIRDPWREAALVIGVSLAVDLVVVTTLAYTRATRAQEALAVLIVIATLGAGAQLAMPALRERTGSASR